MQPLPALLRAVLRKDAQQIAVVKIQRPKAGQLSGGFQAADQSDPQNLRLLFRCSSFGAALGQNAPADVIQRVVLTEIAHQAHESFLARRSDRNILADLHRIALFPQSVKKLPLGHGLPYRLVNVCTDQPSPSGALFLLGTPFAVLLAPSLLRMRDHRQTVFPAKLVGNRLHLVIVLSGTVIFDAVCKGYGVDDKVIVQMIFFVKVGGDDHLIAVAPELGRQFHTDLMCQFGCGLAGGKGLIAVIGYRAVLLTEPLFYCQHFITGGGGRAVDARHKAVEQCAVLTARFLRFLRIDGVADHIGKLLPVLFGQLPGSVEFRVCRLFGILRIDHHLAEPAFYPPNRSRCHRRITSLGGAK